MKLERWMDQSIAGERRRRGGWVGGREGNSWRTGSSMSERCWGLHTAFVHITVFSPLSRGAEMSYEILPTLMVVDIQMIICRHDRSLSLLLFHSHRRVVLSLLSFLLSQVLLLWRLFKCKWKKKRNNVRGCTKNDCLCLCRFDLVSSVPWSRSWSQSRIRWKTKMRIYSYNIYYNKEKYEIYTGIRVKLSLVSHK